jgi:hypothetical protein
MDNLVIEGTERSPEIRLDVGRNHLSISGESYPEDTFVFFEPILDIRLVYFNSSSAKALMNLLEMLDAAAARPDVRVCVNWHYQDQDDMMQELGEEFAEDLKNVRFELVVV